MDIFREKTLNLRNPYALKQLDAFLTPLGFRFDPRAVDYTMVLYDAQGTIAGTGSYQGQVLKYVVVAPSHRATNVSSVIVTHLVRLLMKKHRQIFAFTRPGNAKSFVRHGLQRSGHGGTALYLAGVRLSLDPGLPGIPAVAKSNPCHAPHFLHRGQLQPLLNGHKYLIETAASQSEVVYLFVVEEDRSVFPFKDRWKLVEEGTRHLANVVMLKGGPYVVSGATFPRYFLQNEAPDLVIKNQAELDVMIFARHIVPTLGITRRYVGTEPYSATTRAYNAAMKKILTTSGLK